MHNHHVDWMPSHWITHKLDKLTTVEALWITPMFDVAQSCLPFLFITSFTRDLHCNSILCICQHKLANRDRQHSNVTVTAKMSAWTLQVTTDANTCIQHMTALNRSSQCTAGRKKYEGALTRQSIHCCSALSSGDLSQWCPDHSKSTCK